MKKRIGLLILVIALLINGIIFANGDTERALPEYPTRDVTVSVAWGAGGGTDVICRIVSQKMAEDLDTNFNVINKPGGNGGSIGMSYVLDRPADGYTMLGQVFSLANPAIFGGDWKSKYSDAWEPFL
ncbi:MAG: tripartite tricarboxylate transporter substrate-binding protein, partial [Sphaerochaetaceae bacterium]|nr:tripartite tricarboxylate transporter substrate-binding protein [Sphaerochaetaceae bacterium]